MLSLSRKKYNKLVERCWHARASSPGNLQLTRRALQGGRRGQRSATWLCQSPIPGSRFLVFWKSREVIGSCGKLGWKVMGHTPNMGPSDRYQVLPSCATEMHKFRCGQDRPSHHMSFVSSSFCAMTLTSDNWPPCRCMMCTWPPCFFSSARS